MHYFQIEDKEQLVLMKYDKLD
uniref:Uncharacterized protein n=1 Tax=Arundo donax TaxID=35708 RepID=A0A0A8ZWM3_ARUDO